MYNRDRYFVNLCLILSNVMLAASNGSEVIMTNTILVLGATGGIGGEVARAFLKRGWRVKALTRRPEQAAASRPDLTGVEWVDGDAMNAASVTCHAAGAQIIFHG